MLRACLFYASLLLPLLRGVASSTPVFDVTMLRACLLLPLLRGVASSMPVFDVTTFGARGDGLHDDTNAILSALAEAASVVSGSTTLLFPGPSATDDGGGGRVYRSRPLLLNGTSHLTVSIARGAALTSIGMDHAIAGAWPQVPDLPSYNTSGRKVYQPVLWLVDCHDVEVSGGGSLDGNGTDWWYTALRPPPPGHSTCPDPACPNCTSSCPSRPRLLLVENSTFVTIRDVTLRHSPFWTTHLYNSTDLVVDGLVVDNPSGPPDPTSSNPYVRQFGFGPNADGIDIEHSRRVLVQNCRVTCGDDAICLKAGFAPSELPATADVLVRNNTVFTSCPHLRGYPAGSPHRNDGCGGMKIGYGTFSGVRNVLFDRNTVEFAGLAIKVSSFRGRGGRIQNVSWHNTIVRRAGIAIDVDLDLGRQDPDPDPEQLSVVSGLAVVNLTASVGCGSGMTPGEYCGGAGCIRGNSLRRVEKVWLENVDIIPVDPGGGGGGGSGGGGGEDDDDDDDDDADDDADGSNVAQKVGLQRLGWQCVNASVEQSGEIRPGPVCGSAKGAPSFVCSET